MSSVPRISPRGLVMLSLAGSALALALLPAINTVRSLETGRLSDPFAIDFALPAVSTRLVEAGISILPERVVVGRSGWLFLGDYYGEAISAKRRPADEADRVAARARDASSRAWRTWLAARGVQGWRVLVCADKDSIYPEMLPAWYRPATGTAVDIAFQASDPRLFIDTRPALRHAREVDGPPLYLRTDSHWTSRGAWVAYRELADAWTDGPPGLAWLQPADVRLQAADRRLGDLSALLSVGAPAGDTTALADIAGGRDVDRTRVDAETGSRSGIASWPDSRVPKVPVLIRSPHALNAKRLLWLRDSFGEMLLPYIAATFTEVIQVDRLGATPQKWAALVERYKPDLVLDSVVERDSRAWFPPPPASAQ